EFRETAKLPRARDGSIRRILVSFGGSDHTNQTSKVLRAFKQPGFSSVQIDVVLGRANPYQAEIQSLCAGLPQVQVHLHSDDMATLMQKADLCIGAVGTTSWERCYLGLPALCLTVAHNQSDAAAFLHQAGAVIHLGWFENVTEDDIARSVRHVMEQPSIAADMSVKARRIMKDYDRHAAMLIPAWLSNDKAVNTDE
ncbi:hypothetical protein K0U00_22515, partial [Paenibacillus sepulcri]|nr:hypothetical protein [Paenibacillus sepulcri]